MENTRNRECHPGCEPVGVRRKGVVPDGQRIRGLHRLWRPPSLARTRHRSEGDHQSDGALGCVGDLEPCPSDPCPLVRSRNGTRRGARSPRGRPARPPAHVGRRRYLGARFRSGVREAVLRGTFSALEQQTANAILFAVAFGFVVLSSPEESGSLAFVAPRGVPWPRLVQPIPRARSDSPRLPRVGPDIRRDGWLRREPRGDRGDFRRCRE